MRKHMGSRFDRWLQVSDSGSVGSYLRLLITAPFIITNVLLYGILALVIVFELAMLPSAWEKVKRAFREAEVLGQTDRNRTRMKGGKARQAGFERKGSLVRPGGPLSSDDLRRRLYELRTPKTERMNRRTPNVGGQNGKH